MVRPSGFDPGLLAWKAPKVAPNSYAEPCDERIENKGESQGSIENLEQFLERFSDFCSVDLQLSKSTVYTHKSHIRRFLEGVNKPIRTLTVEDVRNYLLTLKEGSPYTYSNTLKALRRFFRDFLSRPEMIQSFKFPKISPRVKNVPTGEMLRRFYEGLDTLVERAVFLLIASSGLRRSEALNLKLSDVGF